MKDVVIPIVFPEYKILVEVKPKSVDLIPGVNWDNFSTPRFRQRFSDLGHAGVLFINGKTGTTKYYEYGRYPTSVGVGKVKKIDNLPDVKIVNNSIEENSLKKTLAVISDKAGQKGAIKAAYIEVENKYLAMLEYAQFRVGQKTNPDRPDYDLLSNSCLHFMKAITEKAEIDAPLLVDPRPLSYIDEYRKKFRDLDYKNNTLVIESEETDSKKASGF